MYHQIIPERQRGELVLGQKVTAQPGTGLGGGRKQDSGDAYLRLRRSASPTRANPAPIRLVVAGSGTAPVVWTEPDHVLEKIPLEDVAPAMTPAIVVLLNWPVMTSVKAEEVNVPVVSITVPLIV